MKENIDERIDMENYSFNLNATTGEDVFPENHPVQNGMMKRKEKVVVPHTTTYIHVFSRSFFDEFL
ncbi:MAG: hypothetical protein FWJ66_05720 [Caldibacillus sp.]